MDERTTVIDAVLDCYCGVPAEFRLDVLRAYERKKITGRDAIQMLKTYAKCAGGIEAVENDLAVAMEGNGDSTEP